MIMIPMNMMDNTLSEPGMLLMPLFPWINSIIYSMAMQKTHVSMYGRYVSLFFLIFMTASRPKIPLRISLTACRQNSQCIGDHGIHLLPGLIATVYLMKHLSILDEQDSGCMAGRLYAVRHH